MIGQFLGEWFDDLEYFRDLAFVIGERDTFRQHIGNDKKPFQQHVPQLNWSSGLNLILGSTGECDDRGFFLKTLKLAADPGLQPFQKAGLIFRRKADQYRDAIAKENGDAGFANPDRERDRRKSFILEAHGIDAVAQMQGVRGNPCPDFGRNKFGFGHPAVPSSLQASKTAYHCGRLRPNKPRAAATMRMPALLRRWGCGNARIFMLRRQNQPIRPQPAVSPGFQQAAAHGAFGPAGAAFRRSRFGNFIDRSAGSAGKV